MANTRQGIIERLVGIAVSRDIPIEHIEEGRHLLRGESTTVFFDVHEWGDGHLVHLFAPAVVEIPLGQHGDALSFTNRLNRDSYFVKWVVQEYEDEEQLRIFAEYDLLADALDAEEFLNALALVMNDVDSLDEGLASDLGGKTFVEATDGEATDDEATDDEEVAG